MRIAVLDSVLSSGLAVSDHWLNQLGWRCHQGALAGVYQCGAGASSPWPHQEPP